MVGLESRTEENLSEVTLIFHNKLTIRSNAPIIFLKLLVIPNQEKSDKGTFCQEHMKNVGGVAILAPLHYFK